MSKPKTNQSLTPKTEAAQPINKCAQIFQSRSAKLKYSTKTNIDNGTKTTLSVEFPNIKSLCVLTDKNIVATTENFFKIFSVANNKANLFQTVNSEVDFVKGLSRNRFVTVSNNLRMMGLWKRKKGDGVYFVAFTLNFRDVKSDVQALKESINGNKLMSLFDNKLVKVWDLYDASKDHWVDLSEFTVNANTLESFNYREKNRNRSKILFGSGNDIIACNISKHLMSLNISKNKGHSDTITSLNASGDLLVSGSADTKIMIWSLYNFDYLATLTNTHQIDSLRLDVQLSGVISLSDGRISVRKRNKSLEKGGMSTWQLLKRNYSEFVNGDKIKAFTNNDNCVIFHTEKVVQVININNK